MGGVTRIISGRAGGITLDVPGSGTRPTSDRVRESLFGSLESADALDGARVLDLYAGSGALGLEAVSRGAASADLVERDAAAADVVRRNARKVTAAGAAASASVSVHRAAVAAFLRTARGPYDLVFLDPPYDVTDAALDEVLAALAPLLSPDAVVIVERGRRSPRPDWEAAGLRAERDRSYGDTTMWWGGP